MGLGIRSGQAMVQRHGLVPQVLGIVNEHRSDHSVAVAKGRSTQQPSKSSPIGQHSGGVCLNNVRARGVHGNRAPFALGVRQSPRHLAIDSAGKVQRMLDKGE